MSVIADWAATAMFVVFAVAFVAKARSAEAFDDFAASLSQFGMRAIASQRLRPLPCWRWRRLPAPALVLLANHPLPRFALPGCCCWPSARASRRAPGAAGSPPATASAPRRTCRYRPTWRSTSRWPHWVAWPPSPAIRQDRPVIPCWESASGSSPECCSSRSADLYVALSTGRWLPAGARTREG